MQPDILTPGQDLATQYKVKVKKTTAVGMSSFVTEKSSCIGLQTAHQRFMNRHFNPPERLHPVELFVTIKIPADHPFTIDGREFRLAHDVAVRAKREQHLENREQPRVYVDETGCQFTGKFQWAYH